MGRGRGRKGFDHSIQITLLNRLVTSFGTYVALSTSRNRPNPRRSSVRVSSKGEIRLLCTSGYINQLHAVGDHPVSDKLLSVICARIPTNPNSVLLVFSVLSLLAVRQVAHISRTSSVYSLKRGQLVSCIHSVLVSVYTYVCIYMYAYNILGIT